MSRREHRICEFDGCDRPHMAGGLCILHHCRTFDDEAADTPRVCSVDGCNRPFHAKDLCAGHYQRSRRPDGDLQLGKDLRNPPKPPPPPPPDFVATAPPEADESPDWSLFAIPDEDDEPWQDQALCATADPDAWFPEKGGSTRDAKKICSRCSVRLRCLEESLLRDERFGIWGGLSERDRRRVRRGSL